MKKSKQIYRNKRILIASTVVSVLFCLSIIHLFHIRFEAGDVYPPYSSLRSDPLGIKVLYESLHRIDDRNILRNYRTFYRLKPDAQTTLLYFGVPVWALDSFFDKDLPGIEALVQKGARVVISLIPVKRGSPHPTIATKTDEKDNKADTKDKKADSEADDLKTEKDKTHDKEKDLQKDQPYSLFEQWGVDYDAASSSEEQKAKLSHTSELLPQEILWHSLVYFDKLTSDWNVLYTFNSHPVIVEKKLAKGTIVLISDSYFLSNEAMLNARHPSLLSWIMSTQKTVIFDEHHLGIHEKRGISGLARKYHLHGIIAGFLLVAALFIWKNSYSLVPPLDERLDNVNKGSDYTERLVNLLQRHISSNMIIKQCVKEWEKALPFYEKDVQAKLEQVKKVLEQENMHTSTPVKAYNEILRLLSQRG